MASDLQRDLLNDALLGQDSCHAKQKLRTICIPGNTADKRLRMRECNKNGGKFKSILQSKNNHFCCQRLFKQRKKHGGRAVWT